MTIQELSLVICKGIDYLEERKISITERAIIEYGEPLHIGYITKNGYMVENISLPLKMIPGCVVWNEYEWHYTFAKNDTEYTYETERNILLLG